MPKNGSGSPKMSYAGNGKTKHAQRMLRRRAPTESFDFNIRAINLMIDKGEAKIREVKHRRKEVVFAVEGKNYKVIMDKKRKVIITVKRIAMIDQ